MLRNSPKPLPFSIILLIHLHLLGFNGQAHEYDEEMFSLQRPIAVRRERMETIIFFLIGQVEGNASTAKKILPNYPSLHSIDTLSFRNAAAKYFETLRHSALHPATKPGAATLSWWASAPIRKSDLEECSGLKFEKALVALSIHAIRAELLRNADTSCLAFEAALSDSLANAYLSILNSTPIAYFALAEHSSLCRRNLVAQFEALKNRLVSQNQIRSRLVSAVPSSTTCAAPPMTSRLARLRDAKLSELASTTWDPFGGSPVLGEFFRLAGLDGEEKQRLGHSLDDARHYATSKEPRSDMTVEPLPTAAALHPGRLTALVSFPSPASAVSTIEAESHTVSQRAFRSLPLQSLLSQSSSASDLLSKEILAARADSDATRTRLRKLRQKLKPSKPAPGYEKDLFWMPSPIKPLSFQSTLNSSTSKPTLTLFPTSTPLTHAERVLQISNSIRNPKSSPGVEQKKESDARQVPKKSRVPKAIGRQLPLRTDVPQMHRTSATTSPQESKPSS